MSCGEPRREPNPDLTITDEEIAKSPGRGYQFGPRPVRNNPPTVRKPAPPRVRAIPHEPSRTKRSSRQGTRPLLSESSSGGEEANRKVV